MPVPRETREQRKVWARVRRAEGAYARQLRSVARQIGALVELALRTKGHEWVVALNYGNLTPAHSIHNLTFKTKASARAAARVAVEELERSEGVKYQYQIFPHAPSTGTAGLYELEHQLRRYAEKLRPWARAVASRMLADVSRRDEANWNRLSRVMSRELADEIKEAPVGETLRGLLDEQVTLITSLPIEAAERVHRLATEAIHATGGRASTLAVEILKTGHVTTSRANLIARTETARVASNLTQARALYVGSEGYIWRTAGDLDVRPEHKKLNGTFIRWDSPPIAGSKGERAHAGTIYNCRCFPEPQIPDNV